MADVEAMDIEQPDAPARKGKKGGKGDKQEEGDNKGKGKGSGKRFEIKKWNAVAMWSWAICTDTCAICRNNLYEPSIEYQVGSLRHFGQDRTARRSRCQRGCCVAGLEDSPLCWLPPCRQQTTL